jgi:hypothetical protein
MGFPKNAAALGEPDLKMGGLQIWVHGLEYAGAAEPYDADWLRVTAHCGSAGASVWASGAILTASGFERFAQGCHQLYESLQGSASLESYEPNLVSTLSAADRLGHIGLSVEITPDHMSQSHRFHFELDQTFLFDIACQCDAIVDRFPNPHVPK